MKNHSIRSEPEQPESYAGAVLSKLKNKSPNTTGAITLPQLPGTETLCEDVQLSWGGGWEWGEKLVWAQLTEG